MLGTAAAVGGMLAGAAAGAVVSAPAGLIPLGGRVSAGVLLAASLVIASVAVPDRMPQPHRETEQSLLGLGPVRWALANGALLGLGFTSRIGYWIWYLVPLGCFVVGSAPAGAVLWGAYGFTRLGLAAALAMRMRLRPAAMSGLSRSALRLRPLMRRLSAVATPVLGLTLMLWLGI